MCNLMQALWEKRFAKYERSGVCRKKRSADWPESRTHLTMIENGSKQANMETLFRIAQASDLRLSDLIRLAEDEAVLYPND